MKNKILCPECAKRGKQTWLASADGLIGKGFIYLWCKRCHKEIELAIDKI